MSVSDSITDLPPCSPLIFDGSGQWRGHRVVLWDLTKNDSMVYLNLVENCVTHSEIPTGGFLNFQRFLGLQADMEMEITHHHCILPSNYTPPSLGGIKEDPNHLEGDTNRTKDTTCCETNIHPSSFCYLVLIPNQGHQGSSPQWARGRNTPWTGQQSTAQLDNPFRACYMTSNEDE